MKSFIILFISFFFLSLTNSVARDRNVIVNWDKKMYHFEDKFNLTIDSKQKLKQLMLDYQDIHDKIISDKSNNTQEKREKLNVEYINLDMKVKQLLSSPQQQKYEIWKGDFSKYFIQKTPIGSNYDEKNSINYVFYNYYWGDDDWNDKFRIYRWKEYDSMEKEFTFWPKDKEVVVKKKKTKSTKKAKK
jgi:hypothetical protein